LPSERPAIALPIWVVGPRSLDPTAPFKLLLIEARDLEVSFLVSLRFGPLLAL